MAGSLLYNNTLGSPPPSFVFGASQVMGPGSTVLAEGSNAGVPAPANALGQSPGSSTDAAQAIAYGAQAAARPALQQPVFWLIVLLVISVWMLGHVAHVSLK